MERRICLLFFVLILDDVIQAEPSIDVAEKVSDLNVAISKDKRFFKVLKLYGRGRKQNEAEEIYENQENNSQDYPEDQELEFKNSKSRALQVGDTVTPEDMLILAKAYIKKVRNPGEGKGIVSGAANAFSLADALFERYFMTLQRFIVIQDVDIDGLDALQALSLHGEVVDTLRSKEESYTEPPISKYKGFKAPPAIELYDLDPTDLPNRCHYKVLKKWIKEDNNIEVNNNKTKTNRRQADKLKKTLGPIRKLVVNPSKKNRNKKLRAGRRILGLKRAQIQKFLKENIQNSENRTLDTITTTPNTMNSQTNGNNQTCRWKYSCKTPWKLRTCRLFQQCSNVTDYYEMFLDPNQNLRKFREAVGITVIDEEVEKIVELHQMRQYPKHMERDQQIDTLVKYFNDMVAANGAETTPMTTEMKETEKDDKERRMSINTSSSSDEHNINGVKMKSNKAIDDQEASKLLGVKTDKDKDDEEARKLLGVVNKK